jgi:hypothetical protein
MAALLAGAAVVVAAALTVSFARPVADAVADAAHDVLVLADNGLKVVEDAMGLLNPEPPTRSHEAAATAFEAEWGSRIAEASGARTARR